MSGHFPTPGAAALALLTHATDKLNRRTAGFLGQMCVEAAPSEKQIKWLCQLLNQHGLPPLGEVPRG